MGVGVRKLDAWIYRAERAVVVVALMLMALMVFLDVVHRTFAQHDSALASGLIVIAQWFGVEIERTSNLGSNLHAFGPLVSFAQAR